MRIHASKEALELELYKQRLLEKLSKDTEFYQTHEVRIKQRVAALTGINASSFSDEFKVTYGLMRRNPHFRR